MANKPVSIEFVASVAQYLREVKKMEVSTEDVADALVATTHSADDLERKLSRAMRDSAKDTEVLERALKDLPDASDDAARKMDRDFDKIGDDAKDAGREVGDEFKQNLGESLSSGDLEGLVSDTLGGLVASLKGPIGIAGAGAAAVAAIAFNAIKKNWEETQQAITAETESMWSTVLDNIKGKVGQAAASVSKSVLVANELERLWRDDADAMAKLVQQAELLGINSNDVLLAHSGDEAAIKRVNDALRQSETETNNYLGATSDVLAAHDDINKAIYVGGEAIDKNTAKVDAYNDSLPAVAAAHQLIGEHIAGWTSGVQKTQAEIEALRAGLEADPFDLKIRLNVDASALRQLFPYGTSSQADVDKVVAGFNPYAATPGARP